MRRRKAVNRWHVAVVFALLLLGCVAAPVLAATASSSPKGVAQTTIIEGSRVGAGAADTAIASEAERPAQEEVPRPEIIPPAKEPESEIPATDAEQPEWLKRSPALETPAATAERRQSQLDYTDLGPSQEEALLQTEFAPQLEAIDADPSRFLSEVILDQVVSPTEALVTVEGEKMLLESATPVRAPEADGNLGKVDLGLEETDAGYAPANPLVEVGLPQSAAEPIAVGSSGLAFTATGANPNSIARPLDEEDLFLPEVQEDTSFLLSPISGGLELSAMLSSRNSPEQLAFEATLPAGAQLRGTADGGAEVVDQKEEVLYRITSPRVLDAQGTAVPATMAVKGSEIVLQIPHRELDVAYPLFVDPEITENWTNFADTSKLNYWNWQYGGVGPEDYIGQRSPIVDNWGNGLYVRSRPSFTYPAGSYGRWWLGAPNSTAYFDYVSIGPIHYDAHGCTANEPHGYVGVWNDNGSWSAITNAYPSGWITGFGGALPGGSRTIFVGIGATASTNIKCGRDYALNGATLYLTDPENPTVSAPSGIPSGWIKQETALPITVPVSDPGLGVKSAKITSEAPPSPQELGCTGHIGSTCPSSYNFNFSLSAASFLEGERSVSFSATDALGKYSNTQEATLKIDRTKPGLILKGQLAEATEEEGGLAAEEEDETPYDALHFPVYNLTIEATDGSTENATTKRSGVKTVEVFLDSSKTPLKTWSNASCPASSCPLTATYPLKLNELGADTHHTLRVLASDYAGNEPREREIGFEYVPATGERSEYLMQHFPLFDTAAEPEEGVEATGPELAVNLMNGNLVFHQRDVEVPGAAANLEVERFYNSLLPSSQSTEWGDGWTLAQTPTLEADEPEAPGPPSEATLVEESGAVESAVDLPTKTGEERFDPSLQALVTKEPSGYALIDETGESAGPLQFNEAGEATELQASEYAGVHYEYEGGDLSEIAVDDPAGTNLDPEEVNEPTDPPTYESSFGSNGTAGGQLKHPGAVAVDSKGNLFVVEQINNRVDEFNQAGEFVFAFGKEVNKTKVESGGSEAEKNLCTAASGNVCQAGKAGAANGQLSSPTGAAIDAKGNIWIADSANNRIEEFSSAGAYLGQFGTFGYGNGQFRIPYAVAIDSQGNFWVADTNNNRLEEFSGAGAFIRVVGSYGAGNGQFSLPMGIAVDSANDVWVADMINHRIEEFSPSGEYLAQFGTKGSGNGQFKRPVAISVDARNDLWVADSENNRIEEFGPSGEYLAQFGSGGTGTAQFNYRSVAYPNGIAIDAKGDLWATDGNNRVQRWLIPNYAPKYFSAYQSSFGSAGTANGQFSVPADVALGKDGRLLVIDRGNHRVEEFNEAGEFQKAFGSSGSGNGQFGLATALTIDPKGNIWVVDATHNRIEEFNEAGEFLRKFGSEGIAPGKFLEPVGIAADAKGNVWVADTWNHRLQEFNEKGEFVKSIGSHGSGPGQFEVPKGMTIGPDGNIWVTDWTANRVEEFNEAGEFLRQFGSEGTGNGQFKNPRNIAIDGQGNVWVLDKGNQRLQEFSQSGEYSAQFGSAGTGPGQFSFGNWTGIAADAKGDLWVTDPEANRVQRWQAFSYAPPSTETLAADDPSVSVDVSGGLVESVEGEEAGEISYEHEGELLSAVSGPEGETSYEYDGAGHMTKVELPNGSWAEIEYEATYGRVKAVKVSIEGAAPKTTNFEYTDSPSRSTRVVPEGPATVYDMAADGSFVRWQNVGKAPEIEDLGGNLVDPEHRETEKAMAPGAYELNVKAFSAEGIAKIEIIANGNIQVDEKTCTEDFEKVGVECEHVSDPWITESANWAPGILYLEVIVTDREGHEASERFWVNVPYTPPPDPEAEAPPTYTEIKTFREEFGLDLDLKGDEEAINARIFALMGAWYNPNTPAGEVARATSERWGVPLRQVDAAELEYRQAYVEADASKIQEWGENNYPHSYAGYYVDHRNGGIVHVGFVGAQAERLGKLKAVPGLLAVDRFATFPVEPTHSQSELVSLQGAIGVNNSSEAAINGLVDRVGINIAANDVSVGSTEPAPVAAHLFSIYGASAPIEVNVESSPPGPQVLLHERRWQNTGPIFGGQIVNGVNPKEPNLYWPCSSGFDASERLKKRPDGGWNYGYFVITAGHCFEPGWKVYRGLREEVKGVTFVYDPRQIGEQKNRRWVIHKGSSEFETDGEAVALDGNSAELVDPRVYYKHGSTLAINGVAAPKIGEILCDSLGHSNRIACQPLRKPAEINPSYSETPSSGPFWQLPLEVTAEPGDSGSPVFDPNTRAAVGIHVFGNPALITTLLPPPLPEKGIYPWFKPERSQAPGLLNEEFMGKHLHIVTR